VHLLSASEVSLTEVNRIVGFSRFHRHHKQPSHWALSFLDLWG